MRRIHDVDWEMLQDLKMMDAEPANPWEPDVAPEHDWFVRDPDRNLWRIKRSTGPERLTGAGRDRVSGGAHKG